MPQSDRRGAGLDRINGSEPQGCISGVIGVRWGGRAPWPARRRSWFLVGGCIRTLEGGYVCNIPLPRIPGLQSMSTVPCAVTLTESIHTCHDKKNQVNRWLF